MDEALAQTVRERARHVCEYCHMPQAYYQTPFQIEHIIARQHKGRTVLGNLALACLRCNGCKGPNISGIDYATSRTKIVKLFNPRRHKWTHHFRWEGPFLVGKTAIGRVTIQVLAINDPDRVRVREQLLKEGVLPVSS
jgi:hypothetical protein